MGSFDYDDLDAVDLETYSKLVQRVFASVGLVEVDRDILNSVRKSIGVDPLPQDMLPQTDIMTGNSSRASDGMSKGSGNGTSDSVAGTDTSSLNADKCIDSNSGGANHPPFFEKVNGKQSSACSNSRFCIH